MSSDASTDMTWLVTSMPHAEHLGIELVSADKEAVVATMAWREDLCTVAGMAHGGALMAFADSVGAILAFLNLPEGANTSTIESKTNFFRPVTAGSVHGTTKLIHAGRTTIAVQTELRDDAGKLVSLTTQTQAVIPAR
jgi:1,4-dihydroxy-2-naphthoyl-CoA hydrolase